MRAEKRLGELAELQRKAGLLANGTRGMGRPRIGGVRETPPNSEITLEEMGIDKNLAKRARMFASMPKPEFEAAVEKVREEISAASAALALVRPCGEGPACGLAARTGPRRLRGDGE